MATAKKSDLSHHTVRKISEMIVVLVVITLLFIVAIFAILVFDGYHSGRSVVNNYYDYGSMHQTSSSDMVGQHGFQQVMAPAGQAVSGYPAALVPAHGQISSSYHNQYNGYDQYTLVVSTTVPLASEYTAFQSFLSANGFKVTEKNTSKAADTIDAQDGMDYATVQLVPTSANGTSVTINYGTPIK